jgi:hypothetical protein
MPTPKAGLSLMPTNTKNNEQIYNEGLILFESLLYRGVASQSETDPSSLTPADGDAWLLPDGSPNVVGEWVGHEGNVAVYYSGGWRYIPAGEGLTLWVVDESKSVQYQNGVWVDSGTDGGGGGGGTAALIGTIDFSVNSPTTTEAAGRQVTGLSAYRNIMFNIKGLDPAETSSLRLRLLTTGSGTGATGIYDGFFGQFGALEYGQAGASHMNITGLLNPQNVDNLHGTIIGHWSSVLPTNVSGQVYDNDATGSDTVTLWSWETSTTTIYDGLSFLTTTGTISQGTLTVYGWS